MCSSKQSMSESVVGRILYPSSTPAESTRPLVALVWLMVEGSCHPCPATSEALPIGHTLVDKSLNLTLSRAYSRAKHSPVTVPVESEESPPLNLKMHHRSHIEISHSSVHNLEETAAAYGGM